MTDQPSPPPPPPASPTVESSPAAPPPKKGTSPWAWVLIGCLGLLLVLFLLMGTCTWFVGKKVKEVAEDFEANPAKAAAELIVRTNPDLELVDTDEDAGTLTIRNKETGEVVTFNYDEITEGRISFETEGQSYDIGLSEEGEGGAITVTDQSGTAVFQAGAGAKDIPGWLPQYPGSPPEGSYSAVAGGQTSGSYSFETDDPVADVIDYFEEAFGDLGMEVQKTTFSGTGTEGGMVGGETDGRTASAAISRSEGKTRVVVNYTAGGG